jgi:hypothetical protein
MPNPPVPFPLKVLAWQPWQAANEAEPQPEHARDVPEPPPSSRLRRR